MELGDYASQGALFLLCINVGSRALRRCFLGIALDHPMQVSGGPELWQPPLFVTPHRNQQLEISNITVTSPLHPVYVVAL